MKTNLDALQQMIDGMPLFELMLVLRAANSRLITLVDDYGENFVEGLSAEDAKVLTAEAINRLVNDRLLIQISEACEYAGFKTNPGIYAAMRTDNHPMDSLQVVERFLFTKRWIDAYNSHERKTGRPAKRSSD